MWMLRCFPEPDHKGQAALEPYYCFKHKLCNSVLYVWVTVVFWMVACSAETSTYLVSAKSGVVGKKPAMVLHVAWNNRAISCNQ